MSRNFPDRVRPEKVTAARRRFVGQVSLSALGRVVDLVAEPEASDQVEFELQFDRDGHGHWVVDVSLSGEVPLICQRTLKRFKLPIDSRSRVALVDCEEAANELPEDYEPLVCSGDELALLDLIEEELLLALPLVPVDPKTNPIGEIEEETNREPTHRPFEALSKLKKT